MVRTWWCAVALVASASLLLPGTARSEEVYAGDGLTVVVRTLDEETGHVAGEIHRDGNVLPFTGSYEETEDGEIVRGTFTEGGRTAPFTSRSESDSTAIRLTLGGRTYRLLPKADAPTAPAAPEKPSPASLPPVAAGDLKLKRVAFRDINMGGVVAHTMLVPVDWEATGHIEWMPPDNPFPQSRVKVKGPDGSAIAFIPSMTFHYTVMNPVQGFAPIPPQGVAPPERPGDWIVGAVRQGNPKLANVRLVEDRRDLAAERELERTHRAAGVYNAEIRQHLHVVTYAYVENGVPMREQIVLTYARYPDTVNQNLRSAMWSLFSHVVVAAPEAKFEAAQSTLYALAGTYRPVPNWWVQQFEMRQQIINQRTADIWAEIQRRGAYYDQVSDAQLANFRKNMAASDASQKGRIDAIYERQDYRDVDGKPVSLTFHYKHVFSDGSGNYVLTNDSGNRPGSTWTEIQPAK